MFRWYYLASGFFFLQIIGAFGVISRLYYGDWSGGFEQTTKLQIFLNLAMVGVSLSLFGRALWRQRSMSAGAVLAIVFAVFLIMSSAWSIDPSTTIRRGILYTFFILGLIGIAGNLKGEEIIGVLVNVCFVAAIASILLVLVSPANGWMERSSPDDPLALRGVFSHKNVLGEVMVAGALAGAHRFRAGGKGRLWSAVQCLTFLLVALATKSATSLLIVLYLFGASGLILLFRRGGAARSVALLLTVLLLPTAVAADAAQDYLLQLLGKDPTLTGRTELWGVVINEIAQRPIQGWGFFAFWSSANPVANDISASLGWSVPNAHNGMLEMLLETGLVGAGCLIAILIRNTALAVRCLRTPAAEVATTTLLCYSAIVFTGITESVLMDSAEPMTGIFFVLGFVCEGGARRQRSLGKNFVLKTEPKTLAPWRARQAVCT